MKNSLLRKLKRLDKRFRLGLPLLALLLYGTFAQYTAYQAGLLPPSEPAKLTAVSGFDAERPAGTVIVSVSGLAKRRGYYALPPETTLRDLLEFVGLQADSDITAWDLARQPQQGDQYYIAELGADEPDERPWLFNAAAETADEQVDEIVPLNINTATLEELQQLPGIGPSRAQAIVNYRVEHQGFRYVQELLAVKGIGEKIYAQLKDRVSV